MLCCIFHVIRVLSVCFTHFNFVNTIVYWDVLYWISEFQNKHIHSRNQYTPSEWVHQKNRSSHPNSLTHSQFTFVPSLHSQSLLFYSFRERKRKTPSPAQYSIPNKRKWKSYLIWLNSFFGTSQIKSQSITLQSYRSISCDLWFHLKCFACFRIEKDIEASFSLHKVWISHLSHNEK